VDLQAFRALLTPAGQSLLRRVAEGGYDEGTALALGTRLRRQHPAELVAAALTQARLRDRGRAKFGAAAARMYFTPDGLEQATRAPVAQLRARRFAGRARVIDLCCGIGGDLVALAGVAAEVTGVERDPLTAEVARANAEALGLTGRVRVEVADVESYDLTGADAVFCDPARRTSRGRVFDPAAYSPPWPWVVELFARDSGVKVAPGIPHDLVPPGVEAEWVSYRGEVKEAVLWSGDLAGPVTRRATLLPAGATLTADPGLGDPTVGPVGRYLYDLDGALVRAHLVAEVAAAVDGRLVDRTIAYVTADRLVATPYAAAYEVTDVLPFGVKRLRAVLRERGVGIVTVKKRGSAVEPEQLRRRLRLHGDGSAVVVLTRVAGAPTVLLAQPVTGP
jgi:SAM-dependent methyltransferase